MKHRKTPSATIFRVGALAVALCFTGLVPGTATPAAQAQQEDEGRRNTKKTPALREKVYEVLIEAQELGEAGNVDQALRTLDKLKSKDDLNSYEKANMYNFYAFLYYQKEDYRSAIGAYEQVRAQPDLPEAMQTQAIYSLGQLYFTVENYPKAIELLEEWFRQANNPGPQPYVFLSQAYYQQKMYRKALGPLDTAIRVAGEQGKTVQENWLLLKRVYHYELKEYDKVAEVLGILLTRFPKREYWNQLSSVYGELGDTERQLAVLELAYMQNYLDRSQDLRNLAQLYLLNGAPYRGAVVLEKAMADGIVETNLESLRLLSQAWSSAREDEKALPVLQRAASLSNDGKLDLRIAYGYLNTDQYDEAAAAVREALRKGGLRDADEARLLLGTALFNADRLNEAREVFRQANAGNSSKRARQWLTHIEREEQRREVLREVKEQGREQRRRMQEAAEEEAAALAREQDS